MIGGPEDPKIVAIIVLSAICIFLIFTLMWVRYASGELQCINFDKPFAQHIHVWIEGIPIPKVTGVTPYFGGTDTCMREMHTHYDVPIVHLESNNPNKVFTLRPFMDMIGESTMGFSSLTINGNNATFDTPLKDMDRIVLK